MRIGTVCARGGGVMRGQVAETDRVIWDGHTTVGVRGFAQFIGVMVSR